MSICFFLTELCIILAPYRLCVLLNTNSDALSLGFHLNAGSRLVPSLAPPAYGLASLKRSEYFEALSSARRLATFLALYGLAPSLAPGARRPPVFLLFRGGSFCTLVNSEALFGSIWGGSKDTSYI